MSPQGEDREARAQALALYRDHAEMKALFDALWEARDRERGEPTPAEEMLEPFTRLVNARGRYSLDCLLAATRRAEAIGQCDIETVLHFAELLDGRY